MKEEDDRARAEWEKKQEEFEARMQVKMAKLGYAIPLFYFDDSAYQI